LRNVCAHVPFSSTNVTAIVLYRVFFPLNDFNIFLQGLSIRLGSNCHKHFTRNMENIFNPAYREEYFEGYSRGLNPYLHFSPNQYSEAFNSGFHFGRLDYERMNGYITNGIPNLIVTDKILEDFLLAGMLGMCIDADGYTPFQFKIIQKWYQSGVEKYDPDESIYLLAILEKNGIEIGQNG